MKKFTVSLLTLSLLASSLGAAETLYDKAECWMYEGNKEKPVCADGVFSLKGMVHLFGKDPVSVEPGKRYSVTAEIRNPKEEKLPGICIAVVFVKDNGNLIPSREYPTVPGTETVLAAPVWISEHLLGIRPLEPGFKTAQVKPLLPGLDWLEGAMPTPFGTISVIAEKGTDGAVKFDVRKPEEVTLR